MKRNKRGWTKLCSVLIGTCLAFSTVSPAYAAQGASPAETLNSEEVERFADAFFERENVKALNIPGAMFVVVKDDKVLLQKGYGFADLESKTPVDPENTAFRIASISKSITATAVMQLVEQGRIDLDHDVQSYLGDIQLKNNTSSPLTMRHLLTHTTGFDKADPQGLSFDVKQNMSLDDYTKQHMPTIVHTPGEVYKYDNVASMLQGLIVQKIAKQPFHQYVDNNILKPLGMTNSSFVPNKQLRSKLATGYIEQNGTNLPFQPYTLMPDDMPHGGMVSTGSDMARFMMAHLNNGILGNARMLQKSSIQAMQSVQLAIHPELPIMTFGFEYAYQQAYNGQYVIGKLGDTPDFSSWMWLLPEQKVGGFIVANKNTDLRGMIFKAFMDHFFPKSETKQRTYLNPSKQELTRFEGLYSDLRVNYLITRIHAAEDGTLEMKNVVYRQKLRQVDSLLFEDETGALVAFKEGPDGAISYIYSQTYPIAYTVKRPEKKSFSDVPKHHPYAEYINGLHQLHIVNGEPGGTFGPDKPMTRAQFVLQFMTWLGIPAGKPTGRFIDLDGVPGAEFIETAASPQYGLIQGISTDRFEPNRWITRQEAAVILWKVLSILDKPSQEASLSGETDEWALEAVKNIVALKLYGPDIIKSSDGSVDYRSKEAMTRKEAAALMFLVGH